MTDITPGKCGNRGRGHSANALGLCLTLVIGLCLLAAPAWAQGDKPAATPAATATAEGAEGQAPPPAAPLALTSANGQDCYDMVLSHWRDRKQALENYEFSSADEALQRILRQRIDCGLRNLFAVSAALIREAAAARSREEHSRSEALARAATEASPEFPAAWLALARAQFGVSAFRLGDVFRNMGKAMKAATTDVRSTVLLIGNTTFLVSAAFLLAVLLFCLAFVALKLRYFLHDFHHFFPIAVSTTQSHALGALLLAIPLALQLGLFTSCLVWLAVLWTYGNLRERVIAGVIVLAFALSPMLVDRLAELATYPASRAYDIYEVSRVGGMTGARARLETRLEEYPRDVDALLALGVKAKREGDYDKAKKLYQRALDAGAAAPVVLNNLANLAFVNSEFDTAETRYKQAIDLDSSYALVHYNLHLLYYHLAKLELGQESRERALQLDRPMVERFDRLKGDSSNRMAFDAELSDDRLWHATLNREPPDGKVHHQIWSMVSDRIPTGSALPFALALIVLAVGLNFLRRRTGVSVPCARCGRPACQRCEPEIEDDAICEQCFNVFVRKSGVEPRVRIDKEIKVLRYQRRRRNLIQVLSFVLMGSGHLLAGRTLRGVAFILIFCLILLKLVYWDGFLGDPTAVGTGISLISATALVLIFVTSYALSLLDILLRDD